MQAFTPTQIDVLEYWEDLESYYTTGFGTPFNPEIQCEAVQDLFKHLKSNDTPNVIVYFAHSATIRLFLTSLGIGKDNSQLRADNFEQMENRNYRLSRLVPFASNLAAVKYDCADGTKLETKIQFLLNEKPVYFDWCDGSFCNWDNVQENYKHFVNANCSQTFCTSLHNDHSHSMKFSLSHPLVTLLFIFVIYKEIS